MNEGEVPQESLGFDYLKVEGDERKSDYEKGMTCAIETYSIPDKAFRHGKEETIRGAVRLLNGYDVDPLFLEDPERNLFALSISDAWLSIDSISEKKKLLDILKLVSTGIKEDKNFGSLSGRVRVLSEHGSVRGTMFDPESRSGNTHSEYVRLVQQYIESNMDYHQTDRVNAILTDWSDKSMMNVVRKRLKVYQDNEKPFSSLVLNKEAQQMHDDIGYTSLHISSNAGSTVVFNNDWEKNNSLEHEYAHSQGHGLSRWYQNLLFRGMNEALTEKATSNPKTYPNQREVLQQIFTTHPEYESLMYDAYIDSGEARRIMFSKLINDFGLDGFLVFARVAPIDNPKMSGEIGEAIYMEPQIAKEFFINK